MVDMIAANAANGWKRQIAYMHTMPHSTFSFVSPYMASTGLAMVLTPFRQACYTATGSGYSDKAYDNFMHRYRWGGLDVEKPEDAPYLDEQNRTIVVQMRRAMLDLSLRLLRAGGQHVRLPVVSEVPGIRASVCDGAEAGEALHVSR